MTHLIGYLRKHWFRYFCVAGQVVPQNTTAHDFEVWCVFEHLYWWNVGPPNCQVKFLLTVLVRAFVMSSIRSVSSFELGALGTRYHAASGVLWHVWSGAGHCLSEWTVVWARVQPSMAFVLPAVELGLSESTVLLRRTVCLPRYYRDHNPFRFTSHPVIPHQGRFEAIAIHATALGGGVGFVPNVLLHKFLRSVGIVWPWLLVGRAEKVHWAQKCHIRRPWSIPTASLGNQSH